MGSKMRIMFSGYTLDTDKLLKVVTVNGHQSTGRLADVDYGDDNDEGKPILTIERDGMFYSFYADDIALIEAVEAA